MKLLGIFRRHFWVLLIFPLISNCRNEGSIEPNMEPAFNEAEKKVLFIGNSLTYYNNMPDIFKNLASASGKKVYVNQATIGGVDFRYLVKAKSVISKINEMKWDFIVLQSDDITAFGDMYQTEINALESIKKIIYQNNPSSKILYTMIWGLRDGVEVRELNGENVYYSYDEYFKKIYEGTIEISKAVDINISPVGWAWHSAISENTENKKLLFSEDKAHPALHGSYLMACVMNAAIFNDGNAKIEYYAGIQEEQAKYYQQKAVTAIKNYKNGSQINK